MTGSPRPVSRSDGAARRSLLLNDDPLWYKDAVIYELHVRSFRDGDGDGIGDFQGATERLDYLQELGVTALWILPFYPSPLRDDGYDIADYRSVNPDYGTMEDFRTFLSEAHRRGLRVITELVINHTSDQHPWFQRARRAPRGSPEREYYVWSDDPDRYAETRIIFQDFEPSNWTWDPVAEQYFWHRFYHHQPDLNFDNPRVHEELFSVLDHWLEMGVDGLRLDAIPYLYEREGTNCENLPETHAFLKKLRRHVDENFESRMLLAEANQWPEDAAEYFGDGDECHMNFHFPIMPRLFMSLRMEDRFPIVDILEQTPEIPESCQWAIFLRNHDELTLEMVTDEERDYMYRVYAEDPKARINLGIRRRLAPLLQNSRRKIELMKSLLLSLPGTPVLYYGDEIGMGDNFYLGDRNGVRTPMQWNGDRNAGFSDANPQKLFLPVITDPEYHYEAVNVEAQRENPSSLLWWTRRLIALRKRHPAFGRGSFEWLNPGNRRVMAFVRRHEDEVILVVANLSRFSQAIHLELEDFQGRVPVELFGLTPFPAIEDEPYPLTLGPHSFHWLSLEEELSLEGEDGGTARRRKPEPAEKIPLLEVHGEWDELLAPHQDGLLTGAIRSFLPTRRWFAGKGRGIRTVDLVDRIPLALPDVDFRLLLVKVHYVAEDPETYLLPLVWLEGEEAGKALASEPEEVVARIRLQEGEGVLKEALETAAFRSALLEVVAREGRLEGAGGQLLGVADRPGGEILPPEAPSPPSRVGKAEQTNTSVIFGEEWILKLFRRLEAGTNLEREVGRHLTRTGFLHAPEVAGVLEYRKGRRESITLGVLHEYVPNLGDAWEYTLNSLGRVLEEASASSDDPASQPRPPDGLGDLLDRPPPREVRDRLDAAYLQSVELLGRRTAELHGALASDPESPGFRPEPFSTLYQRSLYQSLRNLLGQTRRAVSHRLDDLPGDVRELARQGVLDRTALLDRFREILDRKMEGTRIRTHGDFHLGQVLHTGKDFVIIDFEGEPARALSERRLRRSPLRDVAGMLRSFDYASHTAVLRLEERGVEGTVGESGPDAWGRLWKEWVGAAYLKGYFAVAGESDLIPASDGERELLLDLFQVEKALYEIRYELENRPEWVRIPLQGLLDLS